MELPRGADSKSVERASDRLLDAIASDRSDPEFGGGHQRDTMGTGVTERRLPLESLDLGALGRRVAEIAVERRMSAQRDRHRGLGRELHMGHDTGLGLG